MNLPPGSSSSPAPCLLVLLAYRAATPILRASPIASRMRWKGSARSKAASSRSSTPRTAAASASKWGWQQDRPAARDAGRRALIGAPGGVRRRQPGHRRLQLQPQIQHILPVSNHQLNRNPRLVHQRLPDQVGADVRLQRPAVEDLLHAVGLHRAGQAELQRPAPAVDDKIAAEIAVGVAQHGEKAQRQRAGCLVRSGGRSRGLCSWVISSRMGAGDGRIGGINGRTAPTKTGISINSGERPRRLERNPEASRAGVRSGDPRASGS